MHAVKGPKFAPFRPISYRFRDKWNFFSCKSTARKFIRKLHVVVCQQDTSLTYKVAIGSRSSKVRVQAPYNMVIWSSTNTCAWNLMVIFGPQSVMGTVRIMMIPDSGDLTFRSFWNGSKTTRTPYRHNTMELPLLFLHGLCFLSNPQGSNADSLFF